MSFRLLLLGVSCLIHVSRCVSYTNFAFGDSAVDAGNNNYLPSLSKADYSPYGIDFTPSGGKPTGRYTNGFTIIDIIDDVFGLIRLAQALGAKTLPSPSLARDSLSNAILGGINFASGASGILEETGAIYIARIPLRKQIDNFEQSRGEMVEKMGENGTQNILKNAVFSITSGSNDIITYLFLRNLPFVSTYGMSPTNLQDYMVSNMTIHLKRLHKLGARKIVVVDIGPLGCLPFVRGVHVLPAGQCHEEMNTVIRGYNEKLRVAVHGLNQEMGSTGSIFVYANSYDVIYGMIQNYRDYGFENVNEPCCGGYFPPFSCFQVEDVSEISSNICKDRSKYLFWDAYHPGQAANFIIAQHMLNGDENICFPINVRALHNHKP